MTGRGAGVAPTPNLPRTTLVPRSFGGGGTGTGAAPGVTFGGTALNIEAGHPIRVLVIDDHVAVREGLAHLLARENIVVCAEAEVSREVLAALERVRPDVAIVDMSLGHESGLDLTVELKARGIPVIIYSVHEEGELVFRALAAGARGYLSKRETHRVLVEAIREVAAGREYLGQRAAAALLAMRRQAH